jgi:hypothetical protein
MLKEVAGTALREPQGERVWIPLVVRLSNHDMIKMDFSTSCPENTVLGAASLRSSV